MAQFDVYELDGVLVLDVQTDLLGRMPGRLVCPLRKEPDELVPHPRMNPRVAVLGEAYVVHMQYLSAVPSAQLKSPIDNLDPFYDRIKSAYDMMFNGF
jgi:toxin CcdB